MKDEGLFFGKRETCLRLSRLKVTRELGSGSGSEFSGKGLGHPKEVAKDAERKTSF